MVLFRKMTKENQKDSARIKKTPERLMGIDYGKKKVGIALTDEGSNMAFPKYVLQNDDKIFEKVQKIIEEENIKKVIIGRSLDYNMNPNPIMNEIRGFRRKLETRLRVETDYQDEFLTTQEALRIQGRTDLTDASAAALILKSYIEREE